MLRSTENFNIFIITIAPFIGAIALVMSVSSAASHVDVGIPMDHTGNELVRGLQLMFISWIPKREKK